MDKIVEILNGIKPECDFAKSKDFIADGYLDSFDIVLLVSEIEMQYNITIDALDILPENFCSVDALKTLIEKNGGIAE